MTRRIHITSTSNERLKSVRRLARKRAADRLVVEGHRQLRCALDARVRVLEVYAARELWLGSGDAELVALAERRGALVHELSAAAFVSVSGHVRADGLLAVVERPAPSLELGEFVVVGDGIERPGNLGTIVRTACASGADALVASECATDLFHPDAVRGSVGTIFSLPALATSVRDALARLDGHRLVVASPHASTPYWEADYTSAVAVVVGSERHGAAGAWLDAADERVAIPMAEGADSLNVAVAAGIVLFEAARQRRLQGLFALAHTMGSGVS